MSSILVQEPMIIVILGLVLAVIYLVRRRADLSYRSELGKETSSLGVSSFAQTLSSASSKPADFKPILGLIREEVAGLRDRKVLDEGLSDAMTRFYISDLLNRCDLYLKKDRLEASSAETIFREYLAIRNLYTSSKEV